MRHFEKEAKHPEQGLLPYSLYPQIEQCTRSTLDFHLRFALDPNKILKKGNFLLNASNTCRYETIALGDVLTTVCCHYSIILDPVFFLDSVNRASIGCILFFCYFLIPSFTFLLLIDKLKLLVLDIMVRPYNLASYSSNLFFFFNNRMFPSSLHNFTEFSPVL